MQVSRDLLTAQILNAGSFNSTTNSSVIFTGGFRRLKVIWVQGVHVTPGASTVKLQHSADGSTGWTDLSGSEKAVQSSTPFSFAMECSKLPNPYVRLVLNVTAGALVGGGIAELVDPDSDASAGEVNGIFTDEIFTLE
jgi:hypothetical protein